jgi:hypothetical protein
MSNGDKALPTSSSIERELHVDQVRLYYDVLRLLTANRVPFAVSGAFAFAEPSVGFYNFFTFANFDLSGNA